MVEEVSGRVLLITPIDGGSLHSFAESKAEKMAEADIEPLFKQVFYLYREIILILKHIVLNSDSKNSGVLPRDRHNRSRSEAEEVRFRQRDE